MKANLMLGMMCAVVSLAVAPRAGDLEDQAYDEGWDAAHDFCKDVKDDKVRTYGPRGITDRFKKNCKQGFDAYIDHNRSCKRKLRRMEDGYRRMWKARRESCT